MKKCNCCGNQVSDKEQSCPFCGSVFPETTEVSVYETDSPPNSDAALAKQGIAKEKINRKKFIIGLGIALAIICVCFISMNQYSKIRPIKERYVSINEKYQNGDYIDALERIDLYRSLYKGGSKKYDSMVEDIHDDIEPKLYSSISSTPLEYLNNILDSCKQYEKHYPNGQHLAEIKKVRQNACEKNAAEGIALARENMKSGKYASAYKNTINDIYSYEYLSEDTMNTINEIKDATYPIFIICYTWYKDTGVSYTFEEDGHMTVGILDRYNASAGPVTDGIEAKRVVDEINTYGRPISGGRWQYQGNQDDYYFYLLFYQSSYFDILYSRKDNLVYMQDQLGDLSVYKTLLKPTKPF